MKIITNLLFNFLLLAALGINMPVGAKNTENGEISVKADNLQKAMRKLWSDHVIWTRDYITAAVQNLPNQKQVATRLLKNQDDIGNAIAGYYGKGAGKKLTDLLKEHILIAVDIVNDAKTQADKKLVLDKARWSKNADHLAQFLSKANPAWPYAQMKQMLHNHLDLTTQELVAQLQKKWVADIAAFDAIFKQILGMADDLSQGIIKQFPEKF